MAAIVPGQFSDAEGSDDDLKPTRFKPDVGRNGRMKATMSQKAKTNKARTNKDNIITDLKAGENTIPKNSG